MYSSSAPPPVGVARKPLPPVGAGSELYIYAGGFGSAGTGSMGTAQTVKGRINVPAACWKVVLVLPDGEGDTRRVRGVTPVIAV